MIQLPRHITGRQPKGTPDSLQTVRPTILAPSPTDPKATAHAVGTHVIRLPRGVEARATKLDGVPVLFAREGKQAHVFVDSLGGVVEVVGFNTAQVDGIHAWLDAAATVPENQSELSTLLDRISARDPGRVDLDPKATDRDTRRAFQLIGLTSAEDREVDRYLALAATLDEGDESGDTEVTRLAKLASELTDG